MNDFDSTADMQIGITDYGKYKGCIDKLRIFSGQEDPDGFKFMQEFSSRNEIGDEVLLGFGIASDNIMMFDEGTGTSLSDEMSELTGTITDTTHILWQPQLEIFSDNSIQQFYNSMERIKCLDNGI